MRNFRKRVVDELVFLGVVVDELLDLADDLELVGKTFVQSGNLDVVAARAVYELGSVFPVLPALLRLGPLLGLHVFH